MGYSETGAVWFERFRVGFGSHVIQARSRLQADVDERFNDENLQPAQRSAPMWRLICTEQLQTQWGVVELDFYDDEGCSSSLKVGIERIVHSRSGSWPPQNVFDARQETLWRTACGKCSTEDECQACEPGQAFI